MLPEPSWWETWSVPAREQALALAGNWLRDEDRERAREMFDEQFDELFSRSAQGFRPLWRSEMPELLITWESRSQG